MRNDIAFAVALAALVPTTSAYAGASSFAVVNAAGADISSLSIRRVGSAQWLALEVAAALGKAAPVSFAHADCAFDLRATLANGTTVTWTGVNLCDVKLVTLRRNAAGLAWVDYD
jgi:hypothetical protein